MLLLLAFSLLMSLTISPALPETAANWMLPIHQICLAHAPLSQHSEIYSAMVCGTRLSDVELRIQFARLGLLHLMVVSGAHLLILESLARRLFSRTGLRHVFLLTWTALLIFTVMNRFQPPVLRAFFLLSLTRLNSRLKLSWTPAQTIALAGTLALVFCRDGFMLGSLALSWTASLAIGIWIRKTADKTPQEFKSIRSSLPLHAAVYLLIIPALLPISVPHPVSVFSNWIFAPLLGAFLFPAALLVYALPFLTPAVDLALDAGFAGLSKLNPLTPEPVGSLALPKYWTWFYLGFLNLGAIIFERAQALSLLRKRPR